MLNIYKFKQNYIDNLKPVKKGNRGKMGLPLALALVELAPFYYTLFTELGYEVYITPFSTRDTYLKGQSQVPSDTICYPTTCTAMLWVNWDGSIIFSSQTLHLI